MKILVNSEKLQIYLTNPSSLLVGFNIKGGFVQQLLALFHQKLHQSHYFTLSFNRYLLRAYKPLGSLQNLGYSAANMNMESPCSLLTRDWGEYGEGTIERSWSIDTKLQLEEKNKLLCSIAQWGENG